MSEDFEKEMNEENEILDAIEEGGMFEGEVYFSTDGKHTVHAKASTPGGRTEMLDWAFKAYGRIKERLGTKAEMWGEAIKNGKNKTEPSQSVATEAPVKACVVEGCQGAMTFRSGISKKTNKPYRGWFCDASDKHIDWEK